MSLKTLLFIGLMLAFPMASNAQPSELAQLDRRVASAHPDVMYRIAASIGRPDSAGLIGRNREWGAFYSVRFQYGAGRALRHGLAANDKSILQPARSAITVGLDSIRQDGSFPAALPERIAMGRQIGVSDQASAAAFFLSDACPALIIAGPTQTEIAQIGKAIGWLSQQDDRLLARDQLAPNRLLINALAFASCGQLIDDKEIMARADAFITSALALVRDDGVFLEAGGSDTSYQAVNLVVAIEISALDGAGRHGVALNTAISRGSAWLTQQVDQNGALDSSANTRTCAAEEFLGRPKEVDLREVFRAFAYAEASEVSTAPDMIAFKAWLSGTPDPCPSQSQ